MQRCGVTSFCAPPTVWRMLIQSDLSALAHPAAAWWSAPASRSTPRSSSRCSKAWGVTIRDGFGQTETTVQIANTPGQPVRPGSMGRPVPGYRVALIDPVTGEPADEGEICLDLDPRPLGLMVGYHGDPELTAERDGRRLLPHRRHRLPGRGRLHHLRRAHRRRVQGLGLPDLAVRAGERADRARGGGRGGGRAVAGRRCGWPCRRRTSCWPRAGPADAATAQAIFAHCREHLSPYQRIRRLEFADLPKTISGKIRRVELREAERMKHPTADATPADEFTDRG